MGGARLVAYWSSIRQSCTAQAQLSADAKQATTAKEACIAILDYVVREVARSRRRVRPRRSDARAAGAAVQNTRPS